jgi:hypothetical protein
VKNSFNLFHWIWGSRGGDREENHQHFIFWRFGGTSVRYLLLARYLLGIRFDSECRRIMLLRNVGELQLEYTASHSTFSISYCRFQAYTVGHIYIYIYIYILGLCTAYQWRDMNTGLVLSILNSKSSLLIVSNRFRCNGKPTYVSPVN